LAYYPVRVKIVTGGQIVFWTISPDIVPGNHSHILPQRPPYSRISHPLAILCPVGNTLYLEAATELVEVVEESWVDYLFLEHLLVSSQYDSRESESR
jgi:hypothetical protein